MKQFLNVIFILSIVAGITACGNKTSTTNPSKAGTAPVIATSQFKVWGNCEQCKETIEGSLKMEGVLKAEWNTDTKLMHVTYDQSKISLDKIQRNVAAVGYDNSIYKGNDTAYSNLPDCCQYERK